MKSFLSFLRIFFVAIVVVVVFDELSLKGSVSSCLFACSNLIGSVCNAFIL